MTDCGLSFSSSAFDTVGTYKLLELPVELVKIIESVGEKPFSLSIRGQTTDDAVLCTWNKTYNIRSVVLSNTIAIVTSRVASDVEGDGELVIRDQVAEILELVPSVPKLHRLGGLLKGSDYDEGREDDDEFQNDGPDQRPAKRARYTYATIRDEIQASEEELARGIKDRHILVLNDRLRPIAPSYLSTVLELLLNYLASLSLSHTAAPVGDLAYALEDNHEVKREVSAQVMTWFGEVHDGEWNMDIDAVLKQVGLGILRAFKNDPITQDEFMGKWRTTVGDTFAANTSMSLLSGNYLEVTTARTAVPVLSYFPSSTLPID